MQQENRDNSTLNNTGILIMDSSINTTGLQHNNITLPSFEASLDDSKATPEKDPSQDTTRRKKKKKVKRKQPDVRQDDGFSE